MDAPEGAYSGFWIDYQLKSLNDDLASIYFALILYDDLKDILEDKIPYN